MDPIVAIFFQVYLLLCRKRAQKQAHFDGGFRRVCSTPTKSCTRCRAQFQAQAEQDMQQAIERSLRDPELRPDSEGHVKNEHSGEMTEEGELRQALEMSLRPRTP